MNTRPSKPPRHQQDWLGPQKKAKQNTKGDTLAGVPADRQNPRDTISAAPRRGKPCQGQDEKLKGRWVGLEAGWLRKAEKLSQCCYGSPEEYGGQTHRWVVRRDSPARAQSLALHFGGGGEARLSKRLCEETKKP